jgi:glucokinase
MMMIDIEVAAAARYNDGLSATQNIKVVLGVDIGGTKIAAGRVDRDARLLSRCELQTLAREPLERSLAQVYWAIESQLDTQVSGIGIAAPGPLNPKTGVIINPSNLPAWRNVPLADLIIERFGLPCRVENDANAAGLAEALYGAGRGCASVFYATISTGIGAGIILDGKVYHGKNGAAAEGGHVTIDYRSPVVCNCGTPGCIEALASGSAIERDGGYDLDELAVKLGAWLGSVVSLLDPDVIVIGGGVSKIGEPLLERLRRELPRRTINQFAAETPIVAAHFGADVGIIGASCAFR